LRTEIRTHRKSPVQVLNDFSIANPVMIIERCKAIISDIHFSMESRELVLKFESENNYATLLKHYLAVIFDVTVYINDL